jgi:hypothetical protein
LNPWWLGLYDRLAVVSAPGLVTDRPIASLLSVESELLTNPIGQVFQQLTMFGEDTDDLCHLRFNPREALGYLAIELRDAPFKLRAMPPELRLSSVDLRRPRNTARFSMCGAPAASS